MTITDDLIIHLGELSRLELSEAEIGARKRDLGEILDYMDRLNALDTTDVPESARAADAPDRFRADAVTNADRRSEMLANAPDRKGDFFKVFKTVE